MLLVKNTPKAIIIGAGIAGIASAIRLRAKGYAVEVFEANEYAGGKLSQIEGNGYRFDAGPSLFTMPSLVEELFELAGEKPEKYFEYLKLNEVCRYFWDDKTELTAWAEISKFAKEFEDKLQVPKEKIIHFLAKSGRNYAILDKLFLQKSLHKLSTWLGKDALVGYLNIPKLGLFGTMNAANEKYFENKKAVQLFNRYATYNGSDPYQTPATLNIIPHLEYNIGAFFPKKGMVDITNSLVQLAERMGVRFNFGRKIEKIIVENAKIKGVKLTNGEEKVADLVVSNMDITATYRKLLPNESHPEKLLNQQKSTSGIVFYWGIKKEFGQLGLHNIFFSDDYKAEFDEMFKNKSISIDPTIYINISSKYKPDDAPEGCENWFVLINAPANEGQNWDELIQKTKENVLNKLSRNLGENIAQLIECEQVLDPRGIEAKTSSVQGALYGNSSNNKYAAFLRHANFSSKIKNLYFVGGSVHPGGGIPLALSSAKIMTNFIK
jgi:phytoene desaturase